MDPEDELFELFLVLPRPVAVRETDAETAHHVAVERARRHVQHVLAFEIESFYHSERSVKVCSMEHRSEQLSTFVKLFNLWGQFLNSRWAVNRGFVFVEFPADKDYLVNEKDEARKE